MTPDKFDRLRSRVAVWKKHCDITGLEWAAKASISDYEFGEIEDELIESLPALIAEIERLKAENERLRGLASCCL